MCALEIKKTGRAEYGQYAKVLVYGEPGCGKTLFGSTARKPLFLNLEAGLMTIADRGIDHVDIHEVVDLQEVLVFLRNKDAHDYDTVVVDTLDELQRVLIADRLKKERHESMQLQDWGYVGEQMQKALRAYRNLPMNVIFLCHAKTDTDSESGAMIWKPMLSGAIADSVGGFVDLVSYLSSVTVKNGEETEVKRVLRFQPSPRFPHIKDRSGKMPPFYELNLTTDFQDILKMVFTNKNSIKATETVGSVETLTDRVPQTQSPPPTPPEAERSPKAATPFDPPPAPKKRVAKTVVQEALPDPVKAIKEKLDGKVVEVKEFPKCSADGCTEVVTDEDLIDVSEIRFRKILCKGHFEAARAESKK